MPQELQVLRCYNCLIFQVHIVRKSTKWECKMCGEKQSLKKVELARLRDDWMEFLRSELYSRLPQQRLAYTTRSKAAPKSLDTLSALEAARQRRPVEKTSTRLLALSREKTKVYGQGSGRDCRAHVQRLNEMYLKKEEQLENRCDHSKIKIQNNLEESSAVSHFSEQKGSGSSSKWDQFLDGIGEETSGNAAVSTFTPQVGSHYGWEETEESTSYIMNCQSTSVDLCSRKRSMISMYPSSYKQQRADVQSNKASVEENEGKLPISGSCKNRLLEYDYTRKKISNEGMPSCNISNDVTHSGAHFLGKECSEEDLDNMLNFDE